MCEPTVEEIKNYIVTALQAFEYDPADTDFQEGYHAALVYMYQDLFMTQEERTLHRQCDESKVQ